MTLTNDQWSDGLAAEDDDGFGFPQAPTFTLPAEAQTGYTDLDEVDPDPADEHADHDSGERGFGDCREPEDDYADPDEGVADYDDYPVDGQALTGPVGGGQTDAAEPRRARRFDGKVAMGFGAAGLVAVLVAIVGAVAVYGSDEPKPTGAPNGADAMALPPTRSAAPAPAPLLRWTARFRSPPMPWARAQRGRRRHRRWPALIPTRRSCVCAAAVTARSSTSSFPVRT